MKNFGKIARLEPSVGRYFANCHLKDDTENSNRYNLLKDSDFRQNEDGLNSLNYRILKITKNKLFTLLQVNY